MIDRLIPPAAPASLPVHPLPIYFLIASFGAALFAIWFLPRARYAGQTFLAFVLLHETLKAALEFFRYPPAPFVQTGSLVLAGLALAALAIVPLRRKARTEPLRAINP